MAHAINASKDIPIVKMIIYASSAELLATTIHQLKLASVLKKRGIFGITKHAYSAYTLVILTLRNLVVKAARTIKLITLIHRYVKAVLYNIPFMMAIIVILALEKSFGIQQGVNVITVLLEHNSIKQ
jgi:hypothetical protein